MTLDTLYHAVVFSDASDIAGASYVVGVGDRVARGAWNHIEKHKSSTWKELKAVEIVLKSFTRILADKKIKWFTDSQNVVQIVEVGSGRSELHTMARAIFSTCIENNISIKIDWIPRSENEKADAISRKVDHDDRSLSELHYLNLERLWGPHSIDRFASFQNHKLSRFNSRYWNPGSERVDAFTQTWSGENNWLVPPISLIANTILHLRASKSKETLIIPEWPSAPFWPLLTNNQGKFVP